MIWVIGNFGCARCKVIYNKIKEEFPDSKYFMLDDIEEEERNFILELANNEGINTLPLVFIVEEQKITTFEELKCI